MTIFLGHATVVHPVFTSRKAIMYFGSFVPAALPVRDVFHKKVAAGGGVQLYKALRLVGMVSPIHELLLTWRRKSPKVFDFRMLRWL